MISFQQTLWSLDTDNEDQLVIEEEDSPELLTACLAHPFFKKDQTLQKLTEFRTIVFKKQRISLQIIPIKIPQPAHNLIPPFSIKAFRSFIYEIIKASPVDLSLKAIEKWTSLNIQPLPFSVNRQTIRSRISPFIFPDGPFQGRLAQTPQTNTLYYSIHPDATDEMCYNFKYANRQVDCGVDFTKYRFFVDKDMNAYGPGQEPKMEEVEEDDVHSVHSEGSFFDDLSVDYQGGCCSFDDDLFFEDVGCGKVDEKLKNECAYVGVKIGDLVANCPLKDHDDMSGVEICLPENEFDDLIVPKTEDFYEFEDYRKNKTEFPTLSVPTGHGPFRNDFMAQSNVEKMHFEDVGDLSWLGLYYENSSLNANALGLNFSFVGDDVPRELVWGIDDE